MKQLIGTSFVAILAAVSSFACSNVAETTDSSESKIVGGTQAAPGAWDGAVALYIGNQQVCGGTLVAPQWVVSAGHCVVSPSKPNGGIDHIVLGRTKLSDASSGESIKVVKAKQHEGFNGQTLVNDISLFQLETPSHSPVAKLVDPTDAATAVVADATTTTVGWGTMSEGSQHTSDVLMQVDVPIIANDKCKAFSQYENVSDGMICAGFIAGGHDSCQGDSGGPLFMKINGEVRHVGLVSWGIGCAEASKPGVYTRTTTHLDWLKTNSAGAITPSLTTASPAPAPAPSTAPTSAPTTAPTNTPPAQ